MCCRHAWEEARVLGSREQAALVRGMEPVTVCLARECGVKGEQGNTGLGL